MQQGGGSNRERGSPSIEQQHMYSSNHEVNSALSAQEQRQAAQASIQASLRNRTDRQAQLQQQEIYLAMLQQQQQQAQQQQEGYTQEEMVQVQQMLMLQHQQEQQAQQQQWVLQQLALQSQQQAAEGRSSGTPPANGNASPPLPSDQRNWRSSGNASPAQSGQTAKRDRVASTADKSVSWRNKGAANPSIGECLISDDGLDQRWSFNSSN